MASYPDHIDRDSGFRLKLPARQSLDAEARQLYDSLTDPKGGTIKGLKGPAGIRLWSPVLARLSQPVNRYLRYETGFSPRLRETAILVAARACDSAFEWAAHEPEALKVGVPAAVAEAIKHRRPTTGLEPHDALVIALGRELFEAKRLTQATFDQAVAAWGPRGLVDLVSLMGNYAATALLLAAFDMQLAPGETALLPDGQA